MKDKISIGSTKIIRRVLCSMSIGGCLVATAGEYGTISLDQRIRFETAEQDGKKDSDNLSSRSRLGYKTPEWNHLQAIVEGEFTWVADQDSYNAAGVHGDSERAVIADPENQQLDQLWVKYNHFDTEVKGGRQVIALDNHRWVGHVGWRQNRQTFDAVTIKNTSIDSLSVYYAWLDNVVRIFGDEAPSSGGNAEEFGSNSHLVNVAYDLKEYGKLAGYVYSLDLDDAPGAISGSDTFGAFYKASYPVAEEWPVDLYVEYARQEEGGDNPQSYSADYYALSASTKYKGLMMEVGYEVLGSDQTGVDTNGAPVYASVKAPLATLHKFNGFADVFLVTPAEGLEDRYVMLGYKLDLGETWGPVIAKLWYHDFESDKGGLDLGQEWDAVVAKPFDVEGIPGKFTFVFKWADYEAGDTGADLTRLTAEMNYQVSF